MEDRYSLKQAMKQPISEKLKTDAHGLKWSKTRVVSSSRSAANKTQIYNARNVNKCIKDKKD